MSIQRKPSTIKKSARPLVGREELGQELVRRPSRMSRAMACRRRESGRSQRRRASGRRSQGARSARGHPTTASVLWRRDRGKR
jgi:hypothetical protein